MKRINLGLIGCGHIANEHLKVIKNLKEVKVECITSRTEKKCKIFAKKHKIKKIYKTPIEMILSEKLDGILILVSAENIFNVTKKILKYKIPLFIEKPIGISLMQSKILKNIAQRNGTLNMVGVNRRYYSIFKKGLNFIKKNGGLQSVYIEGNDRIWKLKKKGNIINSWNYINSIHTVDLIRFFSGDTLKITNKNFQLKNKRKVFISNIISKKKILINFKSNLNTVDGWGIKLFGDKSLVAFKPLENGYAIDENFRRIDFKPDNQDKKFKPGFYNQFKDFIFLIKKQRKRFPMSDINDAYKSMILVKKIFSLKF